MADRPHVLLVLHEMSRTGAPLVALRVFSAIHSSVALRIVSQQSGPLRPHFEELGAISIVDRRSAVAWRAPVTWIRNRVLRLRLRLWRPDVVYANSVLALPIVALLRIPGRIVLHAHESTVFLAAFERVHPGLVASMPHRFIAVSEVAADALANECGVRRDRIDVIPPFVETEYLASRASAEEQAAFVVGGAGHPSWTKGLEIWLQVARDVAASRPEAGIQFRWVGTRDDMESLAFKAMAVKLGLADVQFVDETATPMEEIRQFSVLAVTSWEESASLVTLEAMALGVPVVCFSGAGGPAEELGGTGIALSAFSPSAMADAIVGLFDSQGHREAIVAAQQARVLERFTVANAVAIARTIADTSNTRRT